MPPQTGHRPSRRRLLRAAAGATAAPIFVRGWEAHAARAIAAGPRSAAAKGLPPLPPGIKIAAQIQRDFREEDLRWVKMLGVDWLSTFVDGKGDHTAEYFAGMVARAAAAGLKVWNINNKSVHNMEEVTLNLPGREEKIEAYKQHLRNLARAGVGYTTYAHMGNGIWSSGSEPVRGGATGRAYDLAKGGRGWWDGRYFDPPLTHGRPYTEEEIWANYTYFIKAVAPTAEQEGIRIGIHPDDPPVPILGGIPRCIFGNFNGYVRALEIANSPNVGMCLCAGTWLEGGKLTGKDVLQTIDHFGRRGRLWKIHFRNVSAPLPHFVETWVDEGYMDMLKIMVALKRVDFRGAVIPDHVPGTGTRGDRTGMTYTLGYMKGLLKAVDAGVAGR